MDTDTCRLLQIMQSGDLKQLITDPTHEKGHTLDGIFSNNRELAYTSVLPLSWSDHCAIQFEIKNNYIQIRNVNTKRELSSRDWGRMDMEDFKDMLNSTRRPLPIGIEEATSAYTKWLNSACRKLAPEKKMTFKRAKASAPWYSEELGAKKLTCKHLERAWRKQYADADK